jgi:hypothetical protein
VTAPRIPCPHVPPGAIMCASCWAGVGLPAPRKRATWADLAGLRTPGTIDTTGHEVVVEAPALPAKGGTQ